jgi:hypothetical protein
MKKNFSKLNGGGKYRNHYNIGFKKNANILAENMAITLTPEQIDGLNAIKFIFFKPEKSLEVKIAFLYFKTFRLKTRQISQR